MRHRSLWPFSFLHPAGRGLSASGRILRSMRANSASSSESNSLCADCLMSREYSGTGVDTFQPVRAVLLVRDSLFPRSRHKTVPEVFPKSAVFLQVDLNGHLAALLIGDKMYSGHSFSFLQGRRECNVRVLNGFGGTR